MPRRIAVVGAGPAGLVSAKTMLEAGFDVTVFEMGSDLGGTWRYRNNNGRSFVYRNLHINTPRERTRFSDYPFPDDTGRLPDHRQMYQYLLAYAKHFDVWPCIRFDARVASIKACTTASDSSRWIVSTEDGSAFMFHSVMVCTSPFNIPRHVAEIREAFTGEYIHSAEYDIPEAFVDKCVCVVGIGNSGGDIASDISGVAQRVVLVARSPALIIPQFLMGKEFREAVVFRLQRWRIPSWIQRRVVGLFVYFVHGRMTDLGLKAPQGRLLPTVNSTLVPNLLAGRIVLKNGITLVTENRVTFEDGTSETFDAIISATGFDSDFSFLDPGLVPGREGQLELYRRIIAPGIDGLYFVGFVNLDNPINHACEKQAAWVREVEFGNITLPPRDSMERSIRSKKTWVKRAYGTSKRYALQEESELYYARLRWDLRIGRMKKGWRELTSRLGECL